PSLPICPSILATWRFTCSNLSPLKDFRLSAFSANCSALVDNEMLFISNLVFIDMTSNLFASRHSVYWLKLQRIRGILGFICSKDILIKQAPSKIGDHIRKLCACRPTTRKKLKSFLLFYSGSYCQFFCSLKVATNIFKVF